MCPVSEESNIARQRAAGRRTGGPAYQARRAEISRTAARVFKQRGYRGTTLAHIAEAMDTDRASLYYYVSGKQELFEEIVSDATTRNLARAHQIRDGGGSGAERVRGLIVSLMQSYAEFYPVLYVLLQENLKYLEPARREWAEEMRRVIGEWEQVLVDIVLDGQRDGTIRDSSPAWLIAYGITGMVSWTNRWFAPERIEIPATEIGEAFAAIVLDGLRPAT
jgi:AcrR family transcriptional regulator